MTTPRDAAPASPALAADAAGTGSAAGAAASGAPFVTTLRARPGEIRIDGGSAGNGAGGGAAPDVITVRVQMPEVWDVVRVVAPPTEPVLAVKVRALEALYPEGDVHEQFVLKLGGFEVIDENQSLADAGAKDGSTFLLTHRRRRPVR